MKSIRRSTGARATTGLAAAGCLLSACTEFESASDELQPMTAIKPLGDLMQAPDGDWSCVTTEPRQPAEIPDAPIPSVYGVRAVDLATRQPIAGLIVRACNLTDVECVEPVTPWLNPDAEGWFDIPLTTTFTGYLEIIGPETFPYMFFLNEGPPPRRDDAVLVVSGQAFGGLVQAVGVQPDPQQGAFASRIFNCRGETAAEVALTLNTAAVPFYFTNGLPDITRRQTDEDGVAGFLNVGPGVTVLQATLPDGTVMTERTFFVRPGWLTSAFLRPAPIDSPAASEL